VFSYEIGYSVMLKLALTVAVASPASSLQSGLGLTNGRIFQISNPWGWQGMTLSYYKGG
jgi:hypothetical protein